jgi:hypothetical protein
MAQLQITIDLDNAAFDDDREVGCILDRIASHVTDRDYDYNHWTNVHDINGNPVGKFKVNPEARPSFN